MLEVVSPQRVCQSSLWFSGQSPGLQAMAQIVETLRFQFATAFALEILITVTTDEAVFDHTIKVIARTSRLYLTCLSSRVTYFYLYLFKSIVLNHYKAVIMLYIIALAVKYL